MDNGDVPSIPLQQAQNCIVASIQIELTEEILEEFRKDLLQLLHATRSKGVIIDISGVNIMDLEDFDALRQTLLMAEIMGAKTILTGFQPGVVSCLVDLNADIERINAAFNLDDAFRLMNNILSYDETPTSVSTDKQDEPSQLDLDFNQE